jgi:hypothetical protein
MKMTTDAPKKKQLAEQIQHCNHVIGPTAYHTCARPGALDLAFDGWLVGSSSDHPRSDRSTVSVSVYFTTSGFLVGQIERIIPNKDGPAARPLKKTKAEVFSTHRELVDWLQADGRGWLGDNSKAAFDQACKTLPWLRDANVQKI